MSVAIYHSSRQVWAGLAPLRWSNVESDIGQWFGRVCGAVERLHQVVQQWRDSLPMLFARKAAPDPREERVQYLIECILAGQQNKFDELAELYRSQIYAVAWRYCNHREDALDITQNVLLRIFRALPGWKGKCRFGTWVHRITMNASVDYYRRHLKSEHQRVDPTAVSGGDEPRASSDPFMGVSNETARHHTARREVMEAVYDALPGLSKMQRQCFELRYFHDLSVAEVAEVAGCSEGSVKQHLFRAANKLRDSLDHMRPMLEAGVLSAHED